MAGYCFSFHGEEQVDPRCVWLLPGGKLGQIPVRNADRFPPLKKAVLLPKEEGQIASHGNNHVPNSVSVQVKEVVLQAFCLGTKEGPYRAWAYPQKLLAHGKVYRWLNFFVRTQNGLAVQRVSSQDKKEG